MNLRFAHPRSGAPAGIIVGGGRGLRENIGSLGRRQVRVGGRVWHACAELTGLCCAVHTRAFTHRCPHIGASQLIAVVRRPRFPMLQTVTAGSGGDDAAQLYKLAAARPIAARGAPAAKRATRRQPPRPRAALAALGAAEEPLGAG